MLKVSQSFNGLQEILEFLIFKGTEHIIVPDSPAIFMMLDSLLKSTESLSLLTIHSQGSSHIRPSISLRFINRNDLSEGNNSIMELFELQMGTTQSEPTASMISINVQSLFECLDCSLILALVEPVSGFRSFGSWELLV